MAYRSHMKPFLLLLAALMYTFAAFSQDTTLIAHWKFKGNTLDASGNGHHGTAYNTTYAAGKSGKDTTAYAFNGVNSYVYVPYDNAFNLSRYSICATVKVQGYYPGACQGNQIMTRGQIYTTGSYGLSFDDNAYDSSCSHRDTTKECFITIAGTNATTYYAMQQYSPTVALDRWYSTVVTFDSMNIRMYVDGVLKYTAATSSVPLGTSTEGIYIGMNVLDSISYPYSFKGILDDLRIYNRVLSDSEAVAYQNSPLDTVGSSVDTTHLYVSNPNKPGSISIYPNPAKTDYVNIDGPAMGNISILNQLGQTLLTQTITNNNEKINIRELIPGLYFIYVRNKDEVTTRKFLKE